MNGNELAKEISWVLEKIFNVDIYFAETEEGLLPHEVLYHLIDPTLLFAEDNPYNMQATTANILNDSTSAYDKLVEMLPALPTTPKFTFKLKKFIYALTCFQHKYPNRYSEFVKLSNKNMLLIKYFYSTNEMSTTSSFYTDHFYKNFIFVKSKDRANLDLLIAHSVLLFREVIAELKEVSDTEIHLEPINNILKFSSLAVAKVGFDKVPYADLLPTTEMPELCTTYKNLLLCELKNSGLYEYVKLSPADISVYNAYADSSFNLKTTFYFSNSIYGCTAVTVEESNSKGNVDIYFDVQDLLTTFSTNVVCEIAPPTQKLINYTNRLLASHNIEADSITLDTCHSLTGNFILKPYIAELRNNVDNVSCSQEDILTELFNKINNLLPTNFIGEISSPQHFAEINTLNVRFTVTNALDVQPTVLSTVFNYIKEYYDTIKDLTPCPLEEYALKMCDKYPDYFLQ